jgi:hypothetical protein
MTRTFRDETLGPSLLYDTSAPARTLLEPPRSHERSLALWASPAGYRSENSWLTICVIPATITEDPPKYACPAGAVGELR